MLTVAVMKDDEVLALLTQDEQGTVMGESALGETCLALMFAKISESFVRQIVAGKAEEMLSNLAAESRLQILEAYDDEYHERVGEGDRKNG